MKKNPRIALIFIISLTLLLILVILIIGNKTSLRNAMREDLIGKHQSCHLPCWKGITPAKTTQNEAIRILENIAYIRNTSIKQTGTDEMGGSIWDWKVSGGRIISNLNWQQGIINEIFLGIAFDMSVGDVISDYGPPDAISIIEGGTPEEWYWIVDLYYPKLGLQFKSYTSALSDNMESSTEIGAIGLFPPTSLEARVKYLYPNTSLENMSWLYRSWKGYGNLEKLYSLKKQ